MKKLISLFAILAMVFSMQSCINSGDTPDATQTIALKGYNHIHEPAKVDAPLRNKAAKYEMDINLSQMTMSKYEMDINLSQMTMTLKATGAIESDGEEISLVFNNITLKYDQTNGGFTFSLPEATPVASDGNNYKVTDLNGSIAAYALSNSTRSSMVTAITVLQISYTVNDKYDIFATLQTSTSATPEIYYTNCSTTTSAEGIAPFTTTVTTYLVNFITSTKANVTIVSAQFAQRMPQMTMVFPDVDVEMTASGYVFKADELIPKISDTPMPNYKVTNFRMETSSKGAVASVAFNCNIRGLNYSVAAMGKLLPSAKQNSEK